MAFGPLSQSGAHLELLNVFLIIGCCLGGLAVPFIGGLFLGRLFERRSKTAGGLWLAFVVFGLVLGLASCVYWIVFRPVLDPAVSVADSDYALAHSLVSVGLALRFFFVRNLWGSGQYRRDFRTHGYYWSRGHYALWVQNFDHSVFSLSKVPERTASV